MTIPGCNVITTKREYVLSTKEINTETLAPCDHAEGNTSVFLHLKHAVLEGHKKAFIRTVDTNLVVIAVSTYHILEEMGLKELRIGYGYGKHRRDIPIHNIC